MSSKGKSDLRSFAFDNLVVAATLLLMKLRGIIALPESLGEAIDELSGSDLMRRALGEHIFPRYIELKRKEWDEYRVQVTQWEKDKYLAAL